MQKSYHLELSARGQVVIPKAVRSELGSDISLIQTKPGEYRVVSARHALHKIKGILKLSTESTQNIKDSLRKAEKIA